MTPHDPAACSVFELRQYTLRPGQRDTLIDLFERALVDTQEAAGMTLFGQYRDLDEPDRFTWLRGFADMPARAKALAAFYDGPAWRAHRDAANATMLDSDNVLLLRPARAGSGFRAGERAAGDAAPGGLVAVTLHYFNAPMDAAFVRCLDDAAAHFAIAAGGRSLATLVTEPAANSFPRLPVREGEHVFASFARFDDAAAHARHAGSMASSPGWRVAAKDLDPHLLRTETLRLVPTPRSRTLRSRGEA